MSNATLVEIDHGIGGVATPGSRTVSPNTTTTYTLTARGCGGTVTRQVTILVTVPPTPTPTPNGEGPPAPGIVGPKNNVTLACPPSNVILDWTVPSDPSGIANYRVRLQKRVGADYYVDQKIWDPVTATQVNATSAVDCGDSYRWRVFARDGAGNQGDVSNWAYFGIVLP